MMAVNFMILGSFSNTDWCICSTASIPGSILFPTVLTTKMFGQFSPIFFSQFHPSSAGWSPFAITITKSLSLSFVLSVNPYLPQQGIRFPWKFFISDCTLQGGNVLDFLLLTIMLQPILCLTATPLLCFPNLWSLEHHCSRLQACMLYALQKVHLLSFTCSSISPHSPFHSVSITLFVSLHWSNVSNRSPAMAFFIFKFADVCCMLAHHIYNPGADLRTSASPCPSFLMWLALEHLGCCGVFWLNTLSMFAVAGRSCSVSSFVCVASSHTVYKVAFASLYTLPPTLSIFYFLKLSAVTNGMASAPIIDRTMLNFSSLATLCLHWTKPWCCFTQANRATG